MNQYIRFYPKNIYRSNLRERTFMGLIIRAQNYWAYEKPKIRDPSRRIIKVGPPSSHRRSYIGGVV